MAADPMKRRFQVGWLMVIILALASFIMLGAVQEPIGWSFLGWAVLVPWTIAACGAKKLWPLLLINFVAGFLYYLASLYWLIWVTWPGWLALCFYLSLYYVLYAWLVQDNYLKRRWPFTLVLPVIWVGQEYLRSVVMTGFPWFYLGHSQHESLNLIQIADVVGVYGLTFLLAMVNGLICDLLLRPLRQGQNTGKPVFLSAGPLVLLTAIVVLGVASYGQFRNNQYKPVEGPVVTAIQECIPQTVRGSEITDEEIFIRHREITRNALMDETREDLIVWPETMVSRAINPEFLTISLEELMPAMKDMFRNYEMVNDDTLSEQEKRRGAEGFISESAVYHHELQELARRGTPLLIGAPSKLATDEKLEHYNSAFLYLPHGSQYPEYYSKMHLVPFGEVVPFKKSFPALYRLLNTFSPYDYEYSIDAGDKPTVFEFEDREGVKRRFSVAICYEDVFARVCRKLVHEKETGKKVDFLLNISNDGWFVTGGEILGYKASSELMQHLVICKFRAVENRVSVVRSVNTGISAHINPDGSVNTEAMAGTLAAQPARRAVGVGYLTDRVLIDERVSLYSRMGDVFAKTCTILTGLLLLLTILKRK